MHISHKVELPLENEQTRRGDTNNQTYAHLRVPRKWIQVWLFEMIFIFLLAMLVI